MIATGRELKYSEQNVVLQPQQQQKRELIPNEQKLERQKGQEQIPGGRELKYSEQNARPIRNQ